MPVAPRSPDALRGRGLGAGLAFETTSELEDLDGPLGQDRAAEALRPSRAPTTARGRVPRRRHRRRRPRRAIARLDPSLIVLPAAASAGRPGVVERLLAQGVAVLLAR
jgi:hypothetical protein